MELLVGREAELQAVHEALATMAGPRVLAEPPMCAGLSSGVTEPFGRIHRRHAVVPLVGSGLI
jgi:hypothetical protein